ncbi:MAG: hypothetical protein BGN98_04860 [Microbacterium sp. 69-7]|uniref:hypothetical protein n=1 Tax=Microbacterium sp. 69-7 TaxID=1895784 RepID=UPI000965E6E4|nr:hypothetical protein [Microbacterium sp. 69-7]OJU43099.1 MAG: hypothetical protein BGN98_04860 [Microbacterium sp. 69-7]
MDVHPKLDQLLANPECHAILINALGEYRSLLNRNALDFADEFELAHVERCLAHVDALDEVFQRWP